MDSESLKYNKKRKKSGRKYVSVIQNVFNNQIDLFRLLDSRTSKFIEKYGEAINAYGKREEFDFYVNMIHKTKQSLDELKFWLDELEPHIGFKDEMNNSNREEFQKYFK